MESDSRLIVLTTDFGLYDPYIGVLKGVILGIAPNARLIDLTHEIQPQSIKHAAFTLLTSVEYFPGNTIFLNVVDPGVGTGRNAIAVKAGGYYFIAPDNGLLSYVLKKYSVEDVVMLTNNKYHLKNVSSTFHGRDIFAPVAAYLAMGTDINDLGELISPVGLKTLPNPQCFLDAQGIWHGEILHIDRFGNLISSLSAHALSIEPSELHRQHLNWVFELADIKIRYLSSTFSDVNTGEFVAYIGSSGYLEIGLRDGNAAQQVKITIGQNIYAYRTN